MILEKAVEVHPDADAVSKFANESHACLDGAALVTPPSIDSSTRCTGAYVTDSEQNRKVGICKRVDHPPVLVLAPAACCANQEHSSRAALPV